ncbi:MAG: HAD hydrolase family protein [Ignavibacteriales bacterium]|nr:HAD hydrolase family protein [Ignavibacteriales bacterium]
MSDLNSKLKKIKLLLTDVDGVLTDTGVYYSASGEELKRFSLRDGMGVERLRKIAKVKTGIISGEKSFLVRKRADKLDLEEVYLGIKIKIKTLKSIMKSNELEAEEIAFIGDDVNDLEILEAVGVSACPSDAMKDVKKIVDIVLENKGGHGAFREFAEIIIEAKS